MRLEDKEKIQTDAVTTVDRRVVCCSRLTRYARTARQAESIPPQAKQMIYSQQKQQGNQYASYRHEVGLSLSLSLSLDAVFFPCGV